MAFLKFLLVLNTFFDICQMYKIKDLLTLYDLINFKLNYIKKPSLKNFVGRCQDFKFALVLIKLYNFFYNESKSKAMF